MGADTEPRTSRSPTRVALAILLGPAIALGVWGMTRRDDAGTTSANPSSDEPARTLSPPSAMPSRSKPVVPVAERFPRVRVVDDLFDPPIALGRLPGWSPELVAAVTWPDGTPVILRGHEHRYEALGPDLEPRGVLATENDLTEIHGLPSPHGSTCWVALAAGPRGAGRADTVVGLDATGATTWRWAPAERYVHSIAITYDARGASGVIVGAGGAQGVVALDLDGKPRWDAPKRYVAYEVRTHRAVADRALFLSGGVALFDQTGTVLLGARPFNAREAFGLDRGWFDHGLVLPAADPEDRMSMILAGLHRQPDEPLLLRTDAHGGESWSATPTTEVEEIGLIEPSNRPRLVVVVTAGGELLVVDESGTLCGRVELPGEREHGRLFQYGLAAGRLGVDGWFVAVRLLEGTFLFRMHPERLPPN